MFVWFLLGLSVSAVRLTGRHVVRKLKGEHEVLKAEVLE
jgi:hypothetical protein